VEHYILIFEAIPIMIFLFHCLSVSRLRSCCQLHWSRSPRKTQDSSGSPLLRTNLLEMA